MDIRISSHVAHEASLPSEPSPRVHARKSLIHDGFAQK
jgi:hypothetical protein